MKKIHSFDMVHDSQNMFRLLLKAMSNPLQKVNIQPFAEKLFGNDKGFLAMAMTLLDNEVGFCSFGNQILDEAITSLTLSCTVDCTQADYIWIEGEKNLQTAISQAKCGTLADPHKSATIIIRIGGSQETRLTMSGPGIDGTITVETDPLVEKAVSVRDSLCFEYPQGVDLLFVNEGNEVFAIPRLIKKEEN